MKEERMYILNLLSEGKISADEAANLFNALRKPKKEFWDDDINVDEKLKNFSKTAGDIAKECGAKMGAAYKEMEPKVKKATKAAMKKTASVIDDLSKSIHESLENMEAKEAESCDKGSGGVNIEKDTD